MKHMLKSVTMTQYSQSRVQYSLSVAASSADLGDDVSKYVILRHISVGISLQAEAEISS